MSDRRCAALEYGSSLLAVVLACLARWALDPVLGNSLPYPPFFVAVIFVAWFGGAGPAMLTTALSFIAALFFFVPPRLQLTAKALPDVVGLAMFVMVSLAISVAIEAKRKAQRRAEDSEEAARGKQRQLEDEVRERRTAESALRAQEEWFRTTFSSIGDAVLTTDMTGNVTFLNPAGEALTGWTLAEARGQPLESVFRIINEQTRQTVESPVRRVLREGKIVGLANHTLLIAKDGTEWAIDDSGAPIRDGHGAVSGAVLIFRAVTEQRNMERRRTARLAITQVLAQTESMAAAAPRILQAVCESLEWDLGALWLIDAQTQRMKCLNVWYASGARFEQFEKATRAMSIEGTAGLPGRILASGQPCWIPDVLADAGFLRQAAAGVEGLHGAFGCPIRLGDDVLGAIEFFSHRIREPDDDLLEMMGTIGGQVGQFVERERVEQQLRRSEHDLTDFFENAAIGLHWVSADGIVLRVNQAELDLLGYRREEYVGHPITEFHADQPTISDILARLSAGETLRNYEARLRAKDGSIKVVLIDSNGYWEEGKFIHSRCFTRDITEQKRSEQSVRESEERLRLALDAGHMGTWEWNIATNRVVWSPGLEAIHGMAPGTFPGTFEAVQQDMHPDDRETVLCSIRSAVEHGTEHQVEYRLVLPSGQTYWVEGRGKLFRDEQGRPERMAGVCIDVDRRKRLEEELQHRVEALAEAEGRVRSVVDNVIDGIITFDEEGRVQTLNPAAERIFGYPAAEVVGENVKMLMPEPNRGEHDGYRDSHLRAGQAEIIGSGREVIGRCKDGSTFPMDLAVSGFQLSQGRFFTGIVRDITERKRVEQSLRFLADASAVLAAVVNYESTLRMVADLSVPFFADWCTIDMLEQDGSFRRLAMANVDPAKIKFAEELAERYPPDRAAPQGVYRIAESGQPEFISHVSDEMLQTAARDENHLRILRELGLESYMGVPIKARSKVLGVISFVHAQSGRHYGPANLAFAEELARRAAVALENVQLYEELRDADRRKDEFLATLAHELRNPLAPVRNALQLIRLARDDEETFDHAATVMDRQVHQMVRLIDDLMDVSRITRNKLELRKERIALSDAVESAVETSRHLVDAAQHALSVQLPADELYLDADLTRLAQVFSNLLNNACKYTEPGGRITLSAEQTDHQVVVRVKDTGMGIPAESLGGIFNMFEQVDRSLERAQGGLGIGLTLVRRMVEMHGGSVEAHSKGVGQGSEFVVRLPLDARQPHAAGPTETVAHPAAGGESDSPAPAALARSRILVVDDNKDAAASLHALLRVKGNDVRIAHDGLEAITAVAEFQPDLVLLDIGMPKLNGYDAARRIRDEQTGKEMVLVAMTGWGQQRDIDRSRAAGFDYHMVKPVDPQELDQLLARLG